jgi:hypothetical protein
MDIKYLLDMSMIACLAVSKCFDQAEFTLNFSILAGLTDFSILAGLYSATDLSYIRLA